ncbi:MAG: hypothetical protein ACREHV_07850 [Rhizomicrobium sp.]
MNRPEREETAPAGGTRAEGAHYSQGRFRVKRENLRALRGWCRMAALSA